MPASWRAKGSVIGYHLGKERVRCDEPLECVLASSSMEDRLGDAISYLGETLCPR